jgi:hypothetical protein
MSKGESCRCWESLKQGENSFYARWTMCFIAVFPSMTKGEIVGIIVIDVKGLILSLMSYYRFTNTHNISKINLYIGLQVY